MIESWSDFVLTATGGAIALLCLFEGTRRLGAYGVHRKAMLLILLSAGVCALYGGFAYQRYADLQTTYLLGQAKPAKARPVAWSRASSPEKKELLSQAVARDAFRASGTLGPYVDRNGETRIFVPSQEDLSARERVVAYYSRTEYAARSSLAEALLWMITAIVAVFLGLAMSLDNKAPARPALDDAAAHS